MTNLSELLPSGGGAKEFEAVASGTLPSGQTVVLNANGTVEAVSLSPAGLGTEASLSFGGNQGPSVCKLTDTTFVMTGRDSSNGNQATYVIGTVSNGSITFGSKALIGSIGPYVEHLQAFPLTTDKFVIIYKDGGDGNKGKAVVGEVSGGSASFGSVLTFETGQTSLNNVKAGVGLTDTKFIIVFEDASQSSYAKAVVCTVSGTTITAGTIYTYNTANSSKYNIVDKLSDTQVIIAFSETPQGERGRVLTATISGTSISFGSQVTYDDGGSLTVVFHSIVALSETQFVISYLDKDDSNYGKSIVCSVSGTTVTVGATTDFNIACKNYVPDSVKLNATQFLVAFSPDQTPYTQRELRIGTISSGTITFATAVQFHNGDSNSISYLALLGTRDVILSYDTATVFTARDYQLESTNASDFIGITSEAIANTATGKVNPQGGVATSSTVTSVETYGSSQTYESAESQFNAATYDSNSNRVVVAYSDQGDSGKGYAVVGTVSGNSISFGTPVQFFATEVKYCAITFDPDTNQVVICFADDQANDGRGIVGSVDPSDNSITFGSSATFTTNTVLFVAVTYDTNTDKIVCCYRDFGNSNNLTSAVGTVSGTSITFQTPVVANTGSNGPNAIVFDSSNNKVVILTNEGQGKGFVGTVLGSSPWISFGTDGTFGGGNPSAEISATFDTTNNKVVVSFQDQGDNRGKCAIGTVSGSSITFGSLVEFNGSSITNGTTTTFDSNLSKIIVAWTDQSNSYAGTAISGTVSGSSITFGTSSTWATRGDNLGSTFDPTTNQTVIVYRDVPNSQYGTAIVASTAGATANFVTGSTYYVQNDGTLTTTSSTVTAGKAISTTQLILNGAS